MVFNPVLKILSEYGKIKEKKKKDFFVLLSYEIKIKIGNSALVLILFDIKN